MLLNVLRKTVQLAAGFAEKKSRMFPLFFLNLCIRKNFFSQEVGDLVARNVAMRWDPAERDICSIACLIVKSCLVKACVSS